MVVALQTPATRVDAWALATDHSGSSEPGIAFADQDDIIRVLLTGGR